MAMSHYCRSKDSYNPSSRLVLHTKRETTPAVSMRPVLSEDWIQRGPLRHLFAQQLIKKRGHDPNE